MYNNLKLKALVRKVASMDDFDDKILAYIQIFDNEPKKYHNQIKNYINEFAPDVWKEFAIEDTVNNMTNVIKTYSENKTSNESCSTIADLLNKLK